MKKIKINAKDYEVVEEYKNGLEIELLNEYMTDYFEQYDYVLGDWSYGKLRLKGFCSKDNKIFNNLNDYNKVKEYIKDYCSYQCKYFIIKKL
ncbi:MAG TPA: DUF1027 domain-containing protein [Bacilli bacterium]|nr:DUF1027 domain-containing protein [Bacilli bacterium]